MVSFQVVESEEFLLLPVNQLVDIISSDELNVRNEEQVFQAVMAWVKYNISDRRSNLPMVRMILVSSPHFHSLCPPHVISHCCWATIVITFIDKGHERLETCIPFVDRITGYNLDDKLTPVKYNILDRRIWSCNCHCYDCFVLH